MQIAKFLKKGLTLPLCVLCLFTLNSCVPTKDMIYLQSDNPGQQQADFFNNKEEYRLQKHDVLDIKIYSLNPEINAIFNASATATTQTAQATAQTGGDLYYISGYTIDNDGEIDIPFVGEVAVLGLTLNEAYAAIDAKVATMFNNFHLNVKLGGVRFSALGEFHRPGKHVVMQNQVTILEALALCGDLTAVANRSRLKVIRQHPGGSRTYEVNLLGEEFIESPLYFLQPNDVLYAEPLPQKSWGFGVTGAQTFNTFSTFSALILSVLSLTR